MSNERKFENSLLVKSARLFKVSCGTDIFFVAANSKHQVRALLFKRGGDFNLEQYAIEREAISHVEMIYGEVDDYSVMMEVKKELEELDRTDYSLNCDE